MRRGEERRGGEKRRRSEERRGREGRRRRKEEERRGGELVGRYGATDLSWVARTQRPEAPTQSGWGWRLEAAELRQG